ncbi:tRNA CCA-pyrophosphorylase [Candidatus Thorarchaeota archaeon]|nr:MAG: tRNA CCA-pyrophosphorylase [Candidatus Thorarchaeota archaeon]
MNDEKAIVQITSGRTLIQGRAIEKGKTSQEYLDAVAVCELSDKDMRSLGLEKGDTILVESEFGKTIVRSKLDKNLPDGFAFMPCGPYFNSLIASDTQFSGMPSYKSVKASIRRANGKTIRSIEEMANPGKKVVR